MSKLKTLAKKIYYTNTVERLAARFNLGFRLKRNLGKKKIKIGIAVLAWERPDYLEYCLDSLFKTNLYDYDVTFLINDDGSSDPRVKEIIMKERPAEYKIIRNFTPKGHGSWGAAFNKAMRKLLELDSFDIVGTCDSDALFHPEWLDKSIKIMTWAKAHHRDHKLIKFSPFNSSNFQFHIVLGSYKSPHGNYVVKERMGDVASFYFKDDLLKIGFYDESRDDETLMTRKFKRWGIRNFSTEETFVEHIGHISVLNQWRPKPVDIAVHGISLAPAGWSIDPHQFRYLDKSYYDYYETEYRRYLYETNVINARNVYSRLINLLYIFISRAVYYLLSRVEKLQTRLRLKTSQKVLKGYGDFKVDFTTISSKGMSNIKLDIIIPTIDKDLDVLKYVVEGVRKHLKHPIAEIKIIAPESQNIRNFCSVNNCKFIHEDTVLPVKYKDINYIAGGLNRTGWLYQQLLKFAGKLISSEENYLVVDADYIITSDRRFEKEGLLVLDCSDEYHRKYFEVYTKMFKNPTALPVSLVAHHMIFNQEHLESLKQTLEALHKKKWYEIIIEMADREHSSGFSEYETYGNYVLSHFPQKYVLEYWYNMNMHRGDFEDVYMLGSLINQNTNVYKSITVSNPLVIKA